MIGVEKILKIVNQTRLMAEVTALPPAPPLDFSNHFVGCGNKCWHKSMAGLQRAGKYDRVFNVFVDHLVSEVAHGHPFVSRLEQLQSFRPVKIVDGGG